MQHLFFEYVFLIMVILALVMIANRLNLAYPIVLVIGGLGLSFLSVFPNVSIDPDMVFFIFLPPLLYEAAWQVSWKEFWKFRRVITSFAFPIVILTASVVAFVSAALIPGFTLALGFLLGGIISPPDAISATTIMRQVKVPKNLVSVVEGESLMNDASSLIVFRFALAAVITGQFYIQEAATSFLLVVVMGILIGLAVGCVFYAIHRWLPVSSGIEIVLTFVTPYCMYYAAEHFHFSGVLAVVSGGLFLSARRQQILSYVSRIQGVNVWNNIVFVMNGLIFLLIGLQLQSITAQLGDISLQTATWYGVAISLTLIIARLICALGASAFTMFMSRFITVADANPGWKGPLIIGWSGMRGVVSLAAALSIPLLIADNTAFPYRSLILYITFIVILITLVLQGLTLPWLIRKLKLEARENTISEHDQETIIQKKLAHSTLVYLEQKYGADGVENEHIKQLRSRYQLEFKVFSQELKELHSTENLLIEYQTIYLELLEQQRLMLEQINHKEEFDEELIRKHLTLIDFEELKIRQKALG
jgi:CPA1 family monovalent cation:H+ antiporter